MFVLRQTIFSDSLGKIRLLEYYWDWKLCECVVLGCIYFFSVVAYLTPKMCSDYAKCVALDRSAWCCAPVCISTRKLQTQEGTPMTHVYKRQKHTAKNNHSEEIAGRNCSLLPLVWWCSCAKQVCKTVQGVNHAFNSIPILSRYLWML